MKNFFYIGTIISRFQACEGSYCIFSFKGKFQGHDVASLKLKYFGPGELIPGQEYMVHAIFEGIEEDKACLIGKIEKIRALD